MAKFKTGFLLGALAGTVYALLTTKKSGPERIQGFAHYTQNVTGATEDVQRAVTRLGKAAADLKTEIQTTLQPTLKALNDDVTDFTFQTEAHQQAMQAHLDTIASAIDDINQAADTAATTEADPAADTDVEPAPAPETETPTDPAAK